MPDDTKSLDIVIRTRAELEGAQNAETQLERDIEQAMALRQEYAALEEQLRRTRAAMANFQEDDASEVSPDDGQPQNPGAPKQELPTPSASGGGPENSGQPAQEFPSADAMESALQTQGMESAGARLRAALERNGQANLALLNQTLALVEQQNRALDGLGRRIAELAGQIKDLKKGQ